ncbi:MAG TPA: sugar ABC transporter permease [Candidatus Ornithomonoglobus intestinigallinarum]|uniref:Sugar ABC transporter permease n=1 Tax=Candidatus Ornithomonoglobus intestinigallinarum TaxID=2840894 RepID=A0A9D1H2Z4_9FIRM|nr:sugar ABC transporter permease [Candidatus Ornithomonoglobus intestinigallinarum]
MLLPGLIYILVFKYLPMYGITIAFQDFNIFKGVMGSEWVGMANFEKMFSDPEFYQVFMNTLIISISKLVVLFPLPIVAALMINEIHTAWFKKTTQTIIYLPHFISWVIVAGIFTSLLSPSSGLVNMLITALGGEPVSFMMSNDWFRKVLVFSDGWKETGYGAVVYIAAIAGVDQQLYEAARVDGAGRLRTIWSITLPSIATTIVLMLILRLGSILEAGTEQILAMYNPTVYQTGDVIGTYVYRMGLGQQQYSMTTAVGLFNSVVGFILVVSGNFFSKKISGSSIW